MSLESFKAKELVSGDVTYVGQTQNEKADGFGVREERLASGAVLKYTGEFKDGQREGFGRFETSESEYQLGFYKADKNSGFVLHVKNGQIQRFLKILGDGIEVEIMSQFVPEQLINAREKFENLAKQIGEYISNTTKLETLYQNTNDTLLYASAERARLHQCAEKTELEIQQILSQCIDRFLIQQQVNDLRPREAIYGQDRYFGQLKGQERFGVGQFTGANNEQHLGFFKTRRNGFGSCISQKGEKWYCDWNNGVCDGLIIIEGSNSTKIELLEFVNGALYQNYTEQLSAEQLNTICQQFKNFQNQINEYFANICKIDQIFGTPTEQLNYITQERQKIESSLPTFKSEIILLLQSYIKQNEKYLDQQMLKITLQEQQKGNYQGQFKNNTKYGLGKFTWNSGEIYIGWYSNFRDGFGTTYLNNKDIVSGFWRDGRLSGLGVKIRHNGQIEEIGDYREDKLVVNLKQLAAQQKDSIVNKFRLYQQSLEMFYHSLPQKLNSVELIKEDPMRYRTEIAEIVHQQNLLYYQQLQLCQLEYFNSNFYDNLVKLIQKSYNHQKQALSLPENDQEAQDQKSSSVAKQCDACVAVKDQLAEKEAEIAKLKAQLEEVSKKHNEDQFKLLSQLEKLQQQNSEQQKQIQELQSVEKTE